MNWLDKNGSQRAYHCRRQSRGRAGASLLCNGGIMKKLYCLTILFVLAWLSLVAHGAYVAEFGYSFGVKLAFASTFSIVFTISMIAIILYPNNK